MNTRLQRNMAFLTNLYKRGPFERHAFVLSAPPQAPIWEVGDYTNSDRPVRDWVPWVVEPYLKWLELSEQLHDDGVPTVGLSTGTHIYAEAMGCPVHNYKDTNPAAMPLVQSAAEADALPEPQVQSCRNLMRIFELADLVRQELGPEAVMGPPDLQTGFDTACLVWDKTDFLCSMHADPQAVKRLARKCANLFRNFLIEFYREFPDAALAHCPRTWAPAELGPWVSNDECGMMNVAMFEEFLLPELAELSETFGGLGMHCCADGDHTFASFCKIPNFYAFNRVPTKTQAYEAMFRELGGPDGPVFVPWPPDEATVKMLLDKAPEGSRFIFHCPHQDADKAQEWLARVRGM
ncbi:MAG: hypothetical protein KKI08_20240 [Armatimonadetes bacterium]|nr:hypothetical protein [Armatimonadota bacterium]